MNTPSASIRHWFAALALGSALAATATADVTLTATSPAGSTVIQPGQTFDVELTWSGTPAIAAADYAVTLNTPQILLTGRDFNPALSPYADAPYLAALPAGVTRIDATWFKEGGFTGKDLTLHFSVPANYTGPATLTIGLVVDGVQDGAAAAIPFTVAGTTVNLAPITGATYTWTGASATNLVWGTMFPFATVRDTAVIDPNSTTGDLSISLGAAGTVNTIGIIDMNAHVSNSTRIGFNNTTRETGRKIIFDNGDQLAAVYSDLQTTPASPPAASGTDYLRFELAAAIQMNSDLLVRLKTRRDFSFYEAITESGGSKKLTVDISNSPMDNVFRKINFETTNSYSGGTELIANSVTGTGIPRPYAFYAKATNSLGSGLLTLQSAVLDIRADHTVGGLSSSGTTTQKQAARIVAENTTATRTLTLDFNSSTHTYNGQINNGTLSGTATQAGVIQLVKKGSGTQVLTGSNGYTGPTTVTDGTLLVNGSLAAGSAVTVDANGTLGGTGTVNGPTANHGTIAPGASVGSFNLGAVTMDQNSRLAIEFSDWNGAAGSGWDLLNCASLALAATPDERLVITLQPLALANFSETTKTFTIASSTADITGFDLGTITINKGTMPGNGTWAPQLDGTGKQLQLVYTAGSAQTTPTLTVANSPVIYNGSAQAATVNGSVSGTVSNVQYNNSAMVPTTAGTYAVTADFAPTDSVNYSSLVGASAGNFVIQQATPTLAVTNSPVTYNGSPQAATVTGSVPGTVSNAKYNNLATAPTTAGTYAVTADFAPTDSVNYSSLLGAAAGDFVIQPSPFSDWQSAHFSPAQVAAGLAAADADPDEDGSNNLAEFAFNGDPVNGSSTGLFVTERKDTGADGQQELVFTCAVRRGAVFAANGSNAQVAALIDGVTYTVEASADLTAPWDAAVSTVGSASDTPPAGSGLPTLATGWEYRTFSAFNGLPGKGFIRAQVSGSP